ncbi:hypothetical protein J1605_006633 [Eschrichtius robustus]|uniref:Uncharacterized protein n=1 Tax=Eschrichtius robustus TaxID=9764 RepID=A0AB34H2R3_ESCRO|nr:hypothetical protein J1605_006633 [Eschrichtius robustus]
MDTSKKRTGADLAGTRQSLDWIRRVSAIPHLVLVLTSVSMHGLAVTIHCSCAETRVLHGVPDTAAIIGKLFYYPVSPYAFQGKISQFQVTQVHNVRLPRWLEYSPSIKTLQGLPLEDEGGDYQMMVLVSGDFCFQQMRTASVTFTLHVLDRDEVNEASLIPSPSGYSKVYKDDKATAYSSITEFIKGNALDNKP